MSAWARPALFSAGLTACMIACATTTPLPPTYTQTELKAMCERRGGWWHPNDLVGGYCEYDSKL